jgi:hypothetical protein
MTAATINTDVSTTYIVGDLLVDELCVEGACDCMFLLEHGVDSLLSLGILLAFTLIEPRSLQ